MMNTSCLRRAVAACAVACVLAAGCGDGPSRHIEKAISDYQTGDRDRATARLAVDLLHYAAEFVTEVPHAVCGEKLVFAREGKVLRLLYPVVETFDISGEWRMISFDAERNALAVSNGRALKVLEGGLVRGELVVSPDGKAPITGIIMSHDAVLYSAGQMVYRYEAGSGGGELLFRGAKFPSPIGLAASDTVISSRGSLISLVTGNAGVYRASVADLSTGAVLMKDRPVTSRRSALGDSRFYYVAGSMGAWTIASAGIASGKSDALYQFSDAFDVALAEQGAVVHRADGVWLVNFSSGKKLRLPFEYSLAGQCVNRALIRCGKMSALVDIGKLASKAEEIAARLPDLFSGKTPGK